MKNNLRFKRHTATIILLVGIMFISILPVISAFDFDNIKVYDDKTKTAKIKNCDLWLGVCLNDGEDIANITLNTPHRNVVPMGYQMIAEITLDSKDYLNVLKKMDLIDLRNDKSMERKIDYKYLTTRTIEVNTKVPIINENNETIDYKDVKTFKEKEYWEDFDFNNVKKGVYTIGLFMQINYGDEIEWIPTFYGIQIKEWAVVVQSSGTETIDGDYVVHTFTSNGYFNISAELNTSILIVGGGGGAGSGGNSGGGGAGGLIYNNAYDITEGNYNIIVGSGGIATVGESGTNGGNSSAFGLIAWGGGGGGHLETDGSLGGSGGGQGLDKAGSVALGIVGQGNNGGLGAGGSQTRNPPYGGGGGGGAGAVGDLADGGGGTGVGGAGLSSTIYNGTALWYAGGGGGSKSASGLTSGGIGGGGSGGGNDIEPTAGVDGTGGGGGASENYGTATGTDGGSGIIIIRYLTQIDYPVVTLETPANYTNQTTNEVDFECLAYDYVNDIVNVSLYIDGVINETNTEGLNDTSAWFNKFMSEGWHDWTCEVCSNISACFTAEEFVLNIDLTNPEIAILAPSATIDSHVLNTNIFLNWSANDTNLDMCWYGYEGVNTTVTCLDNSTEVNITNAENRTIYFWVNDTFGHINMTSITWNYNFIETGSSYSSSAYETNNETFKINVTTTQTVTSFSAILNYNGTIHAADSSCNSGNCQISSTIDIPLLNTNQITENKTFYWQLTIFNSTGTSNIDTSTNTQNITYVNMSSYFNPSRAVNFTIHKESDLTDLSADISSSFNYYLGGGSITKTANYSGTSNTFSMYINPNESFTTDSQIDLSATGYDNRRYDFLNEIYTNTTTHKSLYLSNSTFSSDIIVEVRDEGLTPMSGIRVNISRYYPEIGIWNEISSQVTDNFGQFVEKLIQNDVKYMFQFWSSSGTLLKTSDDIRIICRASICVLPFVIEGTTDEFEDFEDVSLFTSDLTYDNTTNLFTFSWNDQTGESIIIRLNVQRYLLNSSTLVCNTTSTSTLSTLTCDVGDSVATYKAQAYRKIFGEREIRIAILNIKANDPYATYGVEGLLWVFLLCFTCLGIGAWNPSVGAILYGVVFVMMGILGIISMPLQVFFANTLIVCIFVWAMKT